MIKPVQFL